MSKLINEQLAKAFFLAGISAIGYTTLRLYRPNY